MGKKMIVPNKEDLAFIKFDPDRDQMLIKTQFWNMMKEASVFDPYTMSMSAITSMVGGSKLEKWLHDPAFRNWFFNQNTTKQKIHAAAELAVDSLIEVMEDKDPINTASRVKASETILRLAGYEPPKSKVIEMADREINKMDENQLRQYIDSNIKRLGYTKINEIEEIRDEIINDDHDE